MPYKKEEWIEAAEAAEIMTQNSDHTVSTDYVRLLSNQGKIRSRPKPRSKRQKQYLKSDIEAYRVKGKGANKVTPQQDEGTTEGTEPAVA